MLARLLPLLASISAIALIAAAPSAHGATFTVNTTVDANDSSTGDGVCKVGAGTTCTLRAALQQANASFGADVVTVPAGTYPLTLGTPLTISQSVTLTGAGARETVIDGADPAGVLTISGGSPVTVRGVALTGGSNGVTASGADVLLDEVAIRDNTYQSIGNGAGVGISVGAGANVQLLRSSVIRNRMLIDGTNGYGAGIYVEGGALTAVASTIADNAIGGATAGTRPNNAFGGGLMVITGSASLRHVTLSGNSIVADSSAQAGGNVYANTGSSLSFEDTLATGGTESGSDPVNCAYGAGTPKVTGRNLDSGATCLFGAGALNGSDPLLRPLGNFGGGTDTAPLQLGSPALNRASACVDGGDQRGAPAAGGACDIGATELSTDLGLTLDASRTSVDPGGDVTYLIRVTNAGPDPATGVAVDLGVPGAQVTRAVASAGSCTAAVRCDVGTLERGASADVTVVVRAGAAGPLTASARVSAATPDSNPANDVAGASTTVTGAAGTADTSAPVLGALKRSGTARTGRAITLTSTLSEAATVDVRVDRLTAGRRGTGKTCRARVRTGRPCTITTLAGKFTRPLGRGPVTLAIPARLGKRTLAPGRYLVTATARDGAGNRSVPRTLTVTVGR